MSIRELSDKQVEALIGQVLRAGTLLSCAVTFIGLAIFLAHHATALPNYHAFDKVKGSFAGPGAMFADIAHGRPKAIIELGILILIATPVARVAFLVGAFALERDRMYVLVSGLVLLILLYSIFFSA